MLDFAIILADAITAAMPKNGNDNLVPETKYPPANERPEMLIK